MPRGSLILVIDDDEAITASLSLLLKHAGHRSLCAAAPDEALRLLATNAIDLVLQDMNFTRKTSGEEGLALLRRIRKRHMHMPVILITAWGSIELAVEGIKAGASDFITKPWQNEQILHAVNTALDVARSGGEPRSRLPEAVGLTPATRAELEKRYDLAGIVGESPSFLAALGIAGKVAGTDASILVTGESGTGKEVLAEFVHRNSPRRDRPFVKVNLGGIPTGLFESEMFGHVRGAFTDAHQDREGRFAHADGGTILLDEIGELDPACQVKMLRVLQERAFEVLGTSRQRALDVRVISATNRDLGQAAEQGEFREDLFYRINLITVRLPGLAQRADDIPLLARHFVTLAGRAYARPELTITGDALAWLQSRPWPGNVRQLQHVIERTVLIADRTVLGLDDLRRTFSIESAGRGEPAEWVAPPDGMTLEEMERAMILRSMNHHGGNLTRVAESLGLSRAALYRRLEKFGIRA